MRRRRASTRHHALIGAAFLVVTAIAIYAAVTREVPFRDHYEIRVEVANSGEVRKGTPVRVAGVAVGSVSSIDPRGGDERGAELTLRIEDEGRPVHADARVKIRMRTALEGNEFIDLEPGSPSTPELADDGVIPASQTAGPVQLDQVLGTLDRSTRDRLVTLLDEYGRALDGDRGGFNRSLPWWKPAYRGSAVVNQALLGERHGDLSSYIRDAGTVADAIDANPESVKTLIARFEETAGALAAERAALGETVAELPATLSTARSSLAAVDAMLPALDALVTDLRPAVRNSVPTIDQTRPFLHQLRLLARPSELRGLAADLRPTVGSLAKLEADLVPLLEQVRAASSCQDQVIIPWAKDTVPDEQFPSTGPVYEEAVRGTLPGLAGESRSGDANGQWFTPLAVAGQNVVALGDSKFAATAVPALGVNPQQPERRPPIRPGVACETQEKPDLRSANGAPPPQFKATLSTPEQLARYEKARTTAVDWLTERLDAQGLDSVLEVADEELSLERLRSLKPVTPGGLGGIVEKRP